MPVRATLARVGRSAGQPAWWLPTKLAAPPLRHQLVSRPRLLLRLDEALRHPLTLITAPAGFGKTTLVSSWCAAAAADSRPFAWLTLDQADDEPVRFWSYVLAALQRIDPAIGDAALASLRSPQPPPVETVLAALLRDLGGIDAEVVLVLDDYHLIERDAVNLQFVFFLDHLPSNVHLVISGRSYPPLQVARLRARNQLLEIRSDELRFRGDELTAFLRDVMRLDLSTDLVDELQHVTEGWPAGIQLAGLSLQQRSDPAAFIRSFTGSHHYVLDYLFEDVLQRQSAQIQTFLLRTAILDRLSGPLCNAVTGEADSQSILEYLERANLFLVPLDEERRWYRYHHMFSDVLRQRLQQTVPDIADLHRRAAQWTAANGFIEVAIDHALAAGDQDEAAVLVEVDGRRLLQSGELATLGSWLAKMPLALVRSRPRLALLQAWLAWVSFAGSQHSSDLDERRNALESWVEEAERKLAAPSPGEDEPGASEVAALRGEAAVLRSHLVRSRDELDRAISLSRQALEQLPANEEWVRGHLLFCLGVAAHLQRDLVTASASHAEAMTLGERSGDPFLALYAAAQLAMVYESQGRLRNAAAVLRSALRLATDENGRRLPVAGLALVGLARLLREWNDLDAAASCLGEGLQLLERGAVYGPGARLEHALLLLAQGDVLGASSAIDQMVALAERLDISEVLLRLKAEQVRLWLTHGQADAAFRWAGAPGLRWDDEPTELTQPAFVMLARVHIARARSQAGRTPDDVKEAVLLLARLRKKAEAGGHHGRLIEIMALEALALAAQGLHAPAVEALARALALAEPEGYVRTFVDEGAPMARLLEELAADQRQSRAAGPILTPRYVEKLLTAFEAEPRAAPAIERRDALTEQLTSRELEVLRLIASGLLNEQIAHELVVGRATVKTHINRIFRKLDVSTRSDAVARARDARLL